MRTRFLLTIIALLFLPSLAAAANSAATDIGSNLLQLVFGFALILALLFASLWLLKKLSLPRGAAGDMVRVVSAAAVGQRERVVLVDVGEKRLVLGVAPGQVSLLDTQPIPAGTSRSAQDNAAAIPPFSQWLKQTLTRQNEK